MNVLEYKLIDNKLYYKNGAFIGYIYREVDGFYVFAPKENSGFLNEHTLKEIASVLVILNEPYEKEIEEYFKKEKQEQTKE